MVGCRIAPPNRIGFIIRGFKQRMCSGQDQFEEYDPEMDINLKQLPVEDRIRIVEDLWDSIASDQKVLPLTVEQVAELDRRLDAFETDGNSGRPAAESISELRKRL